MKLILKITTTLIVYTFLFIDVTSAAAIKRFKTFADVVNDGGYEFAIDTEYFNTSNRYDLNGDEYTLNRNYSFMNVDFNFQGKYGFSEKLEFRLGLRGRYLKSDYDEVGGHSLTSSGLESYMVGAKYQLPSTRWRFAIDLKFRQTTYSNASGINIDLNKMVLGDDGMELTAALLLGYKSSSLFRFSSLLAYNAPPNDLSHEMLYNLQFGWEFYNGTSFLLGIKGIYSLNNDAYNTTHGSTRPDMNTGGSYLYNSRNRQYHAPYIGTKFGFSGVTLDLQAAYRTLGVYADGGLEFTFKLSWGKVGITIEQKKVHKFKEYELEASIIKVSPRGVFVKIDKGVADAIEKGMKMDIFKTDYFSGNLLVATGVVFETRPSYSIIKLIKKYNKNVKIRPGFKARGYLD